LEWKVDSGNAVNSSKNGNVLIKTKKFSFLNDSTTGESESDKLIEDDSNSLRFQQNSNLEL